MDAIVIGSGIGGLTTAALLSRIGKKVLVLEQHYIAGGCTHTFEDKGYEFDTGIHYIGNMHKKHSFSRKLFDLISDNNFGLKFACSNIDIIFLVEYTFISSGTKIILRFNFTSD